MKKLYFLATVLFAALSMTALVGCEEPAPVEPTNAIFSPGRA